MTSTIGAVASQEPGNSEGPSSYRAEASPEASRDAHAAALQLKRREFVGVLAAVLVIGAVMLVTSLGEFRLPMTLQVLALLFSLQLARLTVDLFKLHRMDPAQTLRLEHQEEVEIASESAEHRERTSHVTPVMTYGLGLAIVAVSLVAFYNGSRSFQLAGLVKPAVRAGEWWRLLSASYLHGNIIHLIANMSGLLLLGGMVETYDRRDRLPLVYLASALGGNVASTFLLSGTAVGASGGILGLAGYLIVVGARQPHGAPAWLRKRMLAIVATTAIYGIVGFFFIDNAAHAGGALTGFLIGSVTIPGSGRQWSDRTLRTLDTVSWLSAAVLLTGAGFTITRLLQF